MHRNTNFFKCIYISDHPVHHEEQDHGDGVERVGGHQPRQGAARQDRRLEVRATVRPAPPTHQPPWLPHD